MNFLKFFSKSSTLIMFLVLCNFYFFLTVIAKAYLLNIFIDFFHMIIFLVYYFLILIKFHLKNLFSKQCSYKCYRFELMHFVMP